jgi:hypothetical protein
MTIPIQRTHNKEPNRNIIIGTSSSFGVDSATIKILQLKSLFMSIFSFQFHLPLTPEIRTRFSFSGTQFLLFRDPVLLFRDPVLLFRDLVLLFRDSVLPFRDPVLLFKDPVLLFRDSVLLFRYPISLFQGPCSSFQGPGSPFQGLSSPFQGLGFSFSGKMAGRQSVRREGRKAGRPYPEWPAGRKEGAYDRPCSA